MAPLLGEHPTAFAYLLEAFERLVTPPIEVAVVGPPDAPATASLRAELRQRLIPASVLIAARDRAWAPTSRRSSPIVGPSTEPPPRTCASTTPAASRPPIRQRSERNSTTPSRTGVNRVTYSDGC